MLHDFGGEFEEAKFYSVGKILSESGDYSMIGHLICRARGMD